MTEEKFKLPGSSYEELAKIIKGYGNMSKPASLDDVSKLTGLHKTIVSRNAGFLIEIGVIDSGSKKSVTSHGQGLARALEHDMPEEIANGWLDRIKTTDFLSNILTSIRIRKGMTDETLTSHIAYSAGQPKKSGHMTGARTVIDILRLAGMIEELDGKIVANDLSDPADSSINPDPITSKNVIPESQDSTNTTTSTQELSTTKTVIQNSDAIVRINIDLKVACKPEDLDDMGEKLRRLLDNISSTDDESTIKP